jgi:hypothetical protein
VESCLEASQSLHRISEDYLSGSYGTCLVYSKSHAHNYEKRRIMFIQMKLVNNFLTVTFNLETRKLSQVMETTRSGGDVALRQWRSFGSSCDYAWVTKVERMERLRELSITEDCWHESSVPNVTWLYSPPWHFIKCL